MKKDFIVNKEDMNSNEELKKEQKRLRKEKFCIFASAVFLLGTISVSLYNNHKDDVNIESTSSTDSLDNSNDIENTSNINNESEQLYGIVGYKPIFEIRPYTHIDETGEHTDYEQVIVDYEPIYGYISDSSIENEHSSKTK